MLSLLPAGVEIIPPEPDQRSDLRREAPSVALTFPPSPRSFWGVGQSQESLTFSVLFSPISNNSATSRCAELATVARPCVPDFCFFPLPLEVSASHLAFSGELRRGLLRFELYRRR